jgi:hypothetical protein
VGIDHRGSLYIRERKRESDGLSLKLNLIMGGEVEGIGR